LIVAITIDELNAIRDREKKRIDISENQDGKIRVAIGMATCGIAAGAKSVLGALNREIERRNLKNIEVTQTGCIGVCRLEPIVDVYMPGREKVTYVKMDPEKAARIVAEHLVNQTVVVDYTIGTI